MSNTPEAKNICVFAAGGRATPVFLDHAKRLGEAIADGGYGLVYGGFNIGLMGAVAEAARNRGAFVTGVLPTPDDDPYYMRTDVAAILERTSRVIGTESLVERKRTMLSLSTGAVALAGGYGTFDEIATTLEMGRGRYHRTAQGCLVVLNTEGFYDGLEQQLASMSGQRFTGSSNVEFVSTPEEAVAHITEVRSEPISRGWHRGVLGGEA